MDKSERQALGYLPPVVKTAILTVMGHSKEQINEIRIRTNRPLCLVVGRNNVVTDHVCTDLDLEYVMSKLCKGSLYSYAENIKDGFVAGEGGIRAGVCGRAVVIDGSIDCVRDITSINIRIPHRAVGAADELYSLVTKHGSTLVYSKPGMGKTTLLRELIPLLANIKNGKKVSVIDTRYELHTGSDGDDMADIFLGYPRAPGMLSAVRTMSPEYIICDEIADAGDIEAILSAHSSGVSVVVSAHAGTVEELYKNPHIGELIELGIFSVLYGIKDNGHEVTFYNDRKHG